jgi:hypothetical protein
VLIGAVSLRYMLSILAHATQEAKLTFCKPKLLSGVSGDVMVFSDLLDGDEADRSRGRGGDMLLSCCWMACDGGAEGSSGCDGRLPLNCIKPFGA